MDSTGFLITGAVLVYVLLVLAFRSCRRANLIDWGHGWVNFLDGLNRLFCRHYHRMDDVTLDIPDSGSAVVVSNHVSGLDPLLLIAASRRPLRFIIAREQYDRPLLNWLFRQIGCIPVDRERNPDKALRAALRALRQGDVVALFPHGKIHLDRDPPRKLKPGAAVLSVKTGSPLIPVRIENVKGQGSVLPAVFIPSRIRLVPYPPISDFANGVPELLQRLATVLDRKHKQPQKDF